MEAHLALTQPTQVNKVTTSYEICSGPHDTQYCMEDPEQAFVEYASSRTDEAGGKWYTFKPEQNNFGETYNPSWKSHPNLRCRQPRNSQNKFSNPPNRFQPNGSILNCSFNNRPQGFNNQSNLEGLVSNFMAPQDARLSKFEADFKQQQNEMTNKIDTVLKAITDRIAGVLPRDTIKNPKLSTSLVLSTRSYPTMDPQCSTNVYGSINVVTIHPKQQSDSHDDITEENKEEGKVSPENINVNPSTPPNLSVSFITEKVLKLNSFFKSRRNPIITKGCPSNLKIPCNIGHVHVEKAYIDPNSPLNIMTRMIYNWTVRRKLDPREKSNRGVSNFTGRINGMYVFIGNFTYIIDFMIFEDISSIIDPRLRQVVLEKPFMEISNMTQDNDEECREKLERKVGCLYKMSYKK
ncbi:hypothetical protein Tco_0574985 [Tanacetum coccineum]